MNRPFPPTRWFVSFSHPSFAPLVLVLVLVLVFTCAILAHQRLKKSALTHHCWEATGTAARAGPKAR
ncbi:MAG: hypothetical protein ACKV19_08510 [Verrucomicrobiales bacterium]